MTKAARLTSLANNWSRVYTVCVFWPPKMDSLMLWRPLVIGNHVVFFSFFFFLTIHNLPTGNNIIFFSSVFFRKDSQLTYSYFFLFLSLKIHNLLIFFSCFFPEDLPPYLFFACFFPKDTEPLYSFMLVCFP